MSEKKFKKTEAGEIVFQPFTEIGTDWMLISAGDEKACNMMTASWGNAGIMWGKPVMTVFIRPQRHTKQFVDSNEIFTVSFFDKEYKKVLEYCGRVTGKEMPDKVRQSGLTPWYVDGTVAFQEARRVFVLRKLYQAPIEPESFIKTECMTKWYPQKDFHDMYMAEILAVYEAE